MRSVLLVSVLSLFLAACGHSCSSPGSLVERTIAGQSFQFSYIPAGTFTMGSPSSDTESSDDERPQHQVTISKPFLMLRTEVTQAQWVAIKGSNPSDFTGDTARPVEEVGLYDALEFCNQLSIRDGLPPAYTIKLAYSIYESAVTLNEGATGYRLPTEAEWEYAARGGSTASRYGDLDSIAWYSSNAGGQTHPVAQKRPNSYGLYDMIGNVWEWTQDLKVNYSAGSQTDPQGPASGSDRVFRGGGWRSDASRARAGSRGNFYLPSFDGGSFLGFRLLRSLP